MSTQYFERQPTLVVDLQMLSPEEGGRRTPVIADPQYRPHVVVGDPSQRVARRLGNVSSEECLGVAFLGDVRELTAGVEHTVTPYLMYFEGGVDDSGLIPGAKFTIREGSRVVGFGRVVG